MKQSKKKPAVVQQDISSREYDSILSGVIGLLEEARRMSARSVNAVMTVTYWEIGRRIVEYEQTGEERARYGDILIKQLSIDLTQRFGRGFGPVNLSQMRKFYRLWNEDRIFQTLSEKSQNIQTLSEISPTLSAKSGIRQTLSGKSEIVQAASAKSETLSRKFTLQDLTRAFPLPWSHYVRLLSVEKQEARAFYEAEALRGGWSVRQLDRQINSQFYERALLSRNKAALLKKGSKQLPEDAVTPEQEIKDPLVLEFLGLKDEYSESDLEEALILKLEQTLLEFGTGFAFIARQRRLRIGDEWYRVDLLFYNRRLRCLVVVDLKLGKFTHADAGQMHLYLNYAREHWILPGENPPVGLILCSRRDETVARYALEGLDNKILAAEYKMALPDEKTLAAELEKTRKMLEGRVETKKR